MKTGISWCSTSRRGWWSTPGPGTGAGRCLNALLHHCPELKEIGEVSRPGLVHRLDKDTSGLLVVAKTALAHQALVGQFAARETKKQYLALVWGRLPEPEGRIEADIGRHPTQRHKMTAHARRGKAAVTRWRVLPGIPRPPDPGGTLARNRAHPPTAGPPGLPGPPGPGRRHLRRRRQPPGRPPKLLDLKPLVHRQLLHAWRLAVTHPRTGERLSWEAPLPEDFQAVVDKLESLH